MNNALEIKNLSFSYSSDWTYRKIPAIKNISLSIKAGEAFGFLGNNGGGKTTTIKCILDLLHPQKGSVSIFGVSNKYASARKSVGYLSEQPYFYDYLTVTEIMEMFSGLLGLSHSEAKLKIKAALEKVNVSSRSKSPMRHLSKGLTQRVGLAQALINDPKLLILDEPFSGLDPIGRREFRELFLSLKRAGTTLFMSSHVLSDVEFICDRVSIMSGGEIRGIFDIHDDSVFGAGFFELTLENPDVADPKAHFGAKEAIVESLASRTLVRLRFSERQESEAAMTKALQGSFKINKFKFNRPTLEDIFVKIVSAPK
jgi:ABC-2 type transport system ATP-binding protein